MFRVLVEEERGTMEDAREDQTEAVSGATTSPITSQVLVDSFQLLVVPTRQCSRRVSA